MPKDDEVLIRVRATEATKADCEMRSFRFAVKWFWLLLRLAGGVRRPRRRVLGCYFAGEIETAGSAVEGVLPGEPVFGSTLIRAGSYAEYLVLPARFPLTRKPETMSFAEAAALPLGGLNALRFMRLANRAARFRFAAEDRAGLQALVGLAEAGRIGSIVDTVYPLEQAATRPPPG